MIAMLRGTIVSQTGNALIIDVQGVGYRVAVTPAVLEQPLHTDIFVWTHLVVRDDAMELYGFLSRDELAFFELLLLVSGIGPRSALGIVGLGNLEKVKHAIAAGDSKYLTSVAGIGKKSAEKIVVELRDKIADMPIEATTITQRSTESDVVEALKALGYTPAQAREALNHMSEDARDTKDQLKEALKYLTNADN